MPLTESDRDWLRLVGAICIIVAEVGDDEDIDLALNMEESTMTEFLDRYNLAAINLLAAVDEAGVDMREDDERDAGLGMLMDIDLTAEYRNMEN